MLEGSGSSYLRRRRPWYILFLNRASLMVAQHARLWGHQNHSSWFKYSIIHIYEVSAKLRLVADACTLRLSGGTGYHGAYLRCHTAFFLNYERQSI